MDEIPTCNFYFRSSSVTVCNFEKKWATQLLSLKMDCSDYRIRVWFWWSNKSSLPETRLKISGDKLSMKKILITVWDISQKLKNSKKPAWFLDIRWHSIEGSSSPFLPIQCLKYIDYTSISIWYKRSCTVKKSIRRVNNISHGSSFGLSECVDLTK